MSAANVRFQKLDGSDAAPGEEQCFTITCPKGNTCGTWLIAGRTSIPRDGQNKNGGKAQWDWTQGTSRDAPTFSPSLNCSGCWHGYVRQGRCVDVNGLDEPEPVKS